MDMEEIRYIMRRFCRRSKNIDGSGIEIVCQVNHRGVSKSLTC